MALGLHVLIDLTRHLRIAVESQAFAGQGDQFVIGKDAKKAAKLHGARTEGAGPGEIDKGQHAGNVGGAEFDGRQGGIGCHGLRCNHLQHRLHRQYVELFGSDEGHGRDHQDRRAYRKGGCKVVRAGGRHLLQGGDGADIGREQPHPADSSTVSGEWPVQRVLQMIVELMNSHPKPTGTQSIRIFEPTPRFQPAPAGRPEASARAWVSSVSLITAGPACSC